MKNNISSVVSALTLWSLVILKVSGAVEISWLWVFAPIWIPIVLVLIGGALVVLYVAITELYDEFINGYKG